MRLSKKKTYIWIGGAAIVAIAGFLLSKIGDNNINIANEGNISSIAGINCQNSNARPFAVMLSSDPEARPLSGVGEADIVFEMPVTPNQVTRMMAIFQCNQPKELGSIRSSRLDFLPLALGLNPIYAHFGGEHTVLERLNDGVIDNIDGLKYDGTVYYRKSSIPRPHNSFTDFDSLKKISDKLGYQTTGATISYLHEKNDKSLGVINPPVIYKGNFEVEWAYDQETNSYSRTRAGEEETDKNTGEQVRTKNVVFMETSWSPIDKDYIRIKTIGTGDISVYKNGQMVEGTWSKAGEKEKLFFYDAQEKEMIFAPGSIWVEIITD
ncbi:MAG: DUF3048 domain-containing protein [Candidatus Paceibacterota bacterium]